MRNVGPQSLSIPQSFPLGIMALERIKIVSILSRLLAHASAVAVVIVLFALVGMAQGGTISYARAAASAGTTEAIRDEDAMEGSPIASASATYQEEPGLDFSGTATATAIALGGTSYNEPALLVDAIANYSGPPDLIGYAAFAYAELLDSIVIHVPNTLPPHVEVVMRLSGGLAFDGGSSGTLSIELNTGTSDSFGVALNTNGTFSQLYNVPLLLLPVGDQNEFNYAAGYILSASAHATAGPEGSFSNVNFGHTVKILGFSVTDDNGNPLAATITSDSGTSYVVNPVPEPSTFALAALGVFGVFAFGRRRMRHSAELSPTQANPGLATAASLE